MDDFAQSREPDDLFSDEIEPTDHQVVNRASLPAPARKTSPAKLQGQQRHGGPGGPPNPRGGRRGGHNGRASSQPADKSAEKRRTPSPTEAADISTSNSKPVVVDEARVTSVRGDRSATGPAKPTKKTEAELSELMKSMQLKSAAKAEAHARAEKDQASFLQREQQAAAKRLEERKAIRAQDNEREKNRTRKLQARGGLAWDSEKQESDIVDQTRGPSSMYSRGAHGGVAASHGRGGGGLASSRYGPEIESDETPSRGGRGGRSRGRGRSDYQGGRGGGRGARGSGRGGSNSNGSNSRKSSPPLIGEKEFPALPTPTSKPKSPTGTAATPANIDIKPILAAGAVAVAAPKLKSPTTAAPKPKSATIAAATPKPKSPTRTQATAAKVETKTVPVAATATAPAPASAIARGRKANWADEMATPIEKS